MGFHFSPWTLASKIIYQSKTEKICYIPYDNVMMVSKNTRSGKKMINTDQKTHLKFNNSKGKSGFEKKAFLLPKQTLRIKGYQFIPQDV